MKNEIGMAEQIFGSKYKYVNGQATMWSRRDMWKKLMEFKTELKTAEKALDLACETLDKHFWICCDGIYSDTKENWIKRFKREAKEINK